MLANADDILKLRERLRGDPVWFCRHVLGVKPWAKQCAVLESLRVHDRVAVRSGHGTGKSFIAACAALWFLFSHYPAKVVTTAPTWNQVRHILWNEIRRLCREALVPLGGTVLEERLKLGPDAFAIGLSTDEPERLQGYHAENLLVILDEAPGVAEPLWHAAETLLTGRVGKLLAIGNPTKPAGLFYQAFAPGTSWQTVGISCLDSPNVPRGWTPAAEVDPLAPLPYPRLVTPRWLSARAAEWGEQSPLWQARVLGEFPDDDASLLVPRAWLAAATERARCSRPCRAASPSGSSAPSGETSPPRSPEGSFSARMLGVDVARHGTDDTVFLIRDAARVLHVEPVHGWSTMQTAGYVLHLMEEWRIAPGHVCIDDTGLGAGVTDRLREQGVAIHAVIAAARADDPAHYLNTRAECFWRVRMALQPETERAASDAPPLAIASAYATLQQELAALTFSFTSAGAIRIADKIELRGRLGGSPNHADALALTYATSSHREPRITIL